MVFSPQGAAGATILVATSLKTWTKSVDVLLDTADKSDPIVITGLYIDEFNSFIYIMDPQTTLANGNNLCTITDLSGNVQVNNASAGDYLGQLYLSSVGGLFTVFVDQNGLNFYVVGNDSLLQTITPAKFANQSALAAISPSGKYIAIAGGDSVHPNRKRLQIWKGS